MNSHQNPPYGGPHCQLLKLGGSTIVGLIEREYPNFLSHTYDRLCRSTIGIVNVQTFITMVQCSVPHCKGKGIFRFPKNEKRRNQWERAINVNFHSTVTSRLCPIHFEENHFVQDRESRWTGLLSSKRFLKNNAVPTQRLSMEQETELKIRKIQKRLFGVDAGHSSTSCSRIPKVTNIVTRERFSLGEAVSEVAKENLDNGNLRNKYAEIPDNHDVCLPAVMHNLELLSNNLHESKNNASTKGTSMIKVGDSEGNAKSQDASVQVNAKEDGPISIKSVSTQTNLGYYTIGMFSNDKKGVHFYTGLESYAKFMLVFQTLSPYVDQLRFKQSEVVRVTPEDMFFITLIKLRRNKSNYELSRLFAISETLVSNIFHTWINFMYQLWSLLDTRASRELVDFYMPKSFKQQYPSTRVIVDATEIPIVKPTNPVAQQATFSTYKNRNTVKILVGASPDGLLTHCSAAYGGSTSDRQIVERCDLIQKCQKGDCIMADRGFNVQDICAPHGVTVNIPHFLKGKQQLPGMTVLSDRKLSSKRVHIERLIGLTKTFRILQTPLIPSYTELATKIYFICLMLCNFRDGIVSKKA